MATVTVLRSQKESRHDAKVVCACMEEVLRLCPQITYHRRLREEREHFSYTCKERLTGQMTYTNRHINNVLPKVIHKAR